MAEIGVAAKLTDIPEQSPGSDQQHPPENGKADACTLAFYMVSSHVPPCVTIAKNATQKRKTLKNILETKAFV